MAKLAVLVIHGIGTTRRGYSQRLETHLRREVGQASEELCFTEIDYQKYLQDNQERLWERVKRGLSWRVLRRFLLFYFGDAAAVLYNSRELDSVYLKVQRSIYEAVAQALDRLESPDCPVVIVAQSFGCQVISSYLWDAQHGGGIWAPQHAEAFGTETPDQDAFLRLATTRYLLTTGCNIPLIVSGLKHVVPFDKPNNQFRWLNYFSQDDVLGWPLENLYSYEDASAKPEDVAINVGTLFTSWNPLSHSAYWTSPSFIRPVGRLIKHLLGP